MFSSTLHLAPILAFSVSHISAAPAPSLPPTAVNLVPRADPSNLVIWGDSYGSGIGAGEYLNKIPFTEDWTCSRFTLAYGQQLVGLMNGQIKSPPSHQACANKGAGEISSQQKIDSSADIATLSSGGNNVGFSDIINACVYRFALAGDCDQTLTDAEKAIADDSKLFNPVWNDVYTLLRKVGPIEKKPNFRLFVTGYAKFWNVDDSDDEDQCSKISFNYWANPNGGEKMTKDLRRRMNKLVDNMNAKLKAVVDTWTNPESAPNYDVRVQFINWDDDGLRGHRFCEEGVNEPRYAAQPQADNQWFFQIAVTRGAGFHQMSDTTGDPGWGAQWAKDIAQTQKQNPNLQPADPFKDITIDPNSDFSGGYPLPISEVFHPRPEGHKYIAQQIARALEVDLKTQQTTKPGQQMNGPTIYCQQVSAGGGGNPTCTQVPKGCHITVPQGNTVPKPEC